MSAGTNPCSALIDQHIAAAHGEKPALKYGDARYSFNDLAALVNRAGNVFRDLDVTIDDRILILVRPSPAYFAAVLGAMKIGAIPLIEGEAGIAPEAIDKLAKATEQIKTIVVDEARVPELRGDVSAEILVVGEDGGAHQSFVASLRASASSLSAVLRDESASAVAIVDANGDVRTVSCADLDNPDVFAGHALGGHVQTLGSGAPIDIARQA